MMRKASKFIPVGKSTPLNISGVYVNSKNTVTYMFGVVPHTLFFQGTFFCISSVVLG